MHSCHLLTPSCNLFGDFLIQIFHCARMQLFHCQLSSPSTVGWPHLAPRHPRLWPLPFVWALHQHHGTHCFSVCLTTTDTVSTHSTGVAPAHFHDPTISCICHQGAVAVIATNEGQALDLCDGASFVWRSKYPCDMKVTPIGIHTNWTVVTWQSFYNCKGFLGPCDASQYAWIMIQLMLTILVLWTLIGMLHYW